MKQHQRGYDHHVVGAVHEIVLIDPEPSILRNAMARELDECHASRIVIDLTHIDRITDGILDEVTVFVDDRRSMVRMESGASPVSIEELVEP